MDCYFRQYWRDKRLSFKGLKNNANNLVINQLSLNVAMLEKIWKPDTYFHNGLDSYLHAITRPNKLLRISENGDITYSIRQVYTANNVASTRGSTCIICLQAHSESKMPDDPQQFPHGPANVSSNIWIL